MKTVMKYALVAVPVLVVLVVYNLAKSGNWFGLGSKLP